MMMSFLVSAIIQYLDGSGRTSETMAYVYTALFCIGNLFLAFGFGYYIMVLHEVGMNMRSTCAVMIYKKVTVPLQPSRLPSLMHLSANHTILLICY